MNLNKIKNLAKKILAISLIRESFNKFNYFLYKFLSKSKFFALPYHFLISHNFDREIFAYTNSVYKYYQDLFDVKQSNVVIRRNIHRLEKGLILENQRPIFALDYIEETLESYQILLELSKNIKIDLGELQWAHDVLQAYFDSVDDSHQLIRKLKNKFDTLDKPKMLSKSIKFKPYASVERNNFNIPSYDQLLNLAKKRKSVRIYKNKKVPRNQIDKALKIASLSPTACNRQPFKFLIFDEPKLVKEIANIPFGTGGYADNIPMIIVVIGDLSNYFSSRDRHIIYIDASLAIMSFMFALETLGLSSVAINWPDFSFLENKMKKKLKLKEYERPVLMLAVGYAKDEGKIPFSQKKSIEQLRSYNEVS